MGLFHLIQLGDPRQVNDPLPAFVLITWLTGNFGGRASQKVIVTF